MLKRRTLKLAVAAITIASAAGLTGLGATVASAATPAHAQATSAVAAPAAPPTSNRCLNKVHTIPCWALTKYATTLYLRSGGTVRLGGNDVVLLQCYYFIAGTVYDHVTEENSGHLHDIGHIADSAIELDGNPWSLPSPPSLRLCA
jgi:hypothetical protein